MTKSFKLTYLLHSDTLLGEGIYVNERGLMSLCASFVKKVRGDIPDNITVVISDGLMLDSQEVELLHEGFYRWTWRVSSWPNFYHNGMFGPAEDAINSFFPDARCDGLDGTRLVWIKIQAS